MGCDLCKDVPNDLTLFTSKIVDLERVDEIKTLSVQEKKSIDAIIPKSSRIDQAQFDPNKIRRKVDVSTANKVSKCVCKIIINENKGAKAGTGFFLIYKDKKYLITCYHIVNSEKKKL